MSGQRGIVVVTGASSGIGRATAMAFARQGAVVYLAARRRSALDSLASECRALGGTAFPVWADVTVEEEVEGLAETAVAHHGRIDVWVNNAAVSLFARFAEEPFDQFRRVIEVNALGAALGARAAVRRFREQGEGVLINVGSVLSALPAPYQISYVMSKHAIRALSGSLRTELADAPQIHVSTVLPGPVETPLFDHAANHIGWALTVMRPASDPEKVAAAIVRCARRPRREIRVGAVSQLSRLAALAPGALIERWSGAAVRRGHFTDRPAEPTAGNLFEPVEGDGRTNGGVKAPGPPLGRTVAVGAVGAGLVAWLARARR